jgi:hypothetical protein
MDLKGTSDLICPSLNPPIERGDPFPLFPHKKKENFK